MMCSRGYPRHCTESLVRFGLAEVPNWANRTAGLPLSSQRQLFCSLVAAAALEPDRC